VLSSASESPDFMALYKLVFNFNFNKADLRGIGNRSTIRKAFHQIYN